MAQVECAEGKVDGTKACDMVEVASLKVQKQQDYERMNEFTRNATYTRQQKCYYMVSKISTSHSSIEDRNAFIPPKDISFPQLIDNIDKTLTNVDLNEHYTNDYVPKNSISETQEFTQFVENCNSNANNNNNNSNNSNIKFVTFRNNLNKLLGTVFFAKDSKYDSYKIDIFRKENGIIYLEIVPKPQEKNYNPLNDDSKKFIFWGNYFESIATKFDMKTIDKQLKTHLENVDFEKMNNEAKEMEAAMGMSNNNDKNEKKENTQNNNNNNKIETYSEFCTIMEAKLNNKHKLLIAAEIDCLNKDGQFVEIKTSKYMANRRFNNNNNGRGRGRGMRGRGRGMGRGMRGSYNQGHNQNQRYQHSQRFQRDFSNFPQNAYHLKNASNYDPYPNPMNNNNHWNDNNDNCNNNNKIDGNNIYLPWYRAIKFWIQSYLVGCENLVIGWRDDQGKVLGVTQHTLNDIYSKFCQFRGDHKDMIALNFLDQVLTFIEKNVTKPNVHYQIQFDQPFDCLKLYMLNSS